MCTYSSCTSLSLSLWHQSQEPVCLLPSPGRSVKWAPSAAERPKLLCALLFLIVKSTALFVFTAVGAVWNWKHSSSAICGIIFTNTSGRCVDPFINFLLQRDLGFLVLKHKKLWDTFLNHKFGLLDEHLKKSSEFQFEKFWKVLYNWISSSEMQIGKKFKFYDRILS